MKDHEYYLMIFIFDTKFLKKHICGKESMILWGETWNSYKWNFWFTEVYYCRFSALILTYFYSYAKFSAFWLSNAGLCSFSFWPFLVMKLYILAFLHFYHTIPWWIFIFSLSVYVRISNFYQDLSNIQINSLTTYFL